MKTFKEYLNEEYMTNSKVPLASSEEITGLRHAIKKYNKPHDSVPISFVAIKGLKATQKHADPKTIQNKINDKQLHTKNEPSVIYKYKGKEYIEDGHHKVAAAKEINRSTVAAHYHDLDK